MSEWWFKDGTKYYSFPTIEKLAGEGVEEMLWGLGFGYRAKFISESAKYILKNHSREWLYSLRDVSYEEAKSELLHLCGVGAKVSRCHLKIIGNNTNKRKIKSIRIIKKLTVEASTILNLMVPS